MQYIVRHNFQDFGFGNNLLYYVSNFFKKFYDKLQLKYPEHDFKIESDTNFAQFGNGGTHSCMNLSIINPINNKYILISFWDDWKYHFLKHLGWNAKLMQKFFYCGSFNFVDYFNFKQTNLNNNNFEYPDNIQNIYQSFFYGPYFDSHYDKLEEIYNNRKISNSIINKIQFRGFMWDHRTRMTDMISNLEDFVVIDKNLNNQSLGYIEFLTELSQYKCALGLPGNTNICNRDIECFSIGVPIIRPALDNIISDPLWPDYHYLSFYHAPKYWDGHCFYYSYKDFQEHLIYYWNIVKNNNELLNFISTNANNWYKKNSSADHNVSYILSSMSLNILS